MGYQMPKAFLEKNSSGTIQPIIWWIRVVHTFPNGINPKVNVIARLEMELTYYDFKILTKVSNVFMRNRTYPLML